MCMIAKAIIIQNIFLLSIVLFLYFTLICSEFKSGFHSDKFNWKEIIWTMKTIQIVISIILSDSDKASNCTSSVLSFSMRICKIKTKIMKSPIFFLCRLIYLCASFFIFGQSKDLSHHNKMFHQKCFV